MSDITPNLGLTRWTDTDDTFNHSELAENFHLIDIHDHSTAGVQIPDGGLAQNSVSTANIKDSAITANKIHNGAVTAEKLAEGTITPSKLSVSPYGSYSVIRSVQQTFTSNGSGDNVIAALYLDDAFYSVAGRTPKLRVRQSLYTNNTSPGITFNAKLWPITGTAGATTPTFSLGTATTTTGTLSPGSNSSQHLEGPNIDFPADGHYALGVTFSSNLATNAQVTIALSLEVSL